MKILLKIIAGIVLLFILASVCLALYFRFVFDPNDFRDRITKIVQDETGRTLVIEGDLKISTFPWLSASIGRTTLSDAPAFGSDPMLTFESVSASVKLLPLLKKQVELGTTTIDGGRINLIRLADGTTNWGMLLDDLEGDTASATPATESAFKKQSLGAIAISDTTVVFSDQLPNAEFEKLTLSGFNLTTGELKPGAPFDVDLKSRVDAARVGLDVTIAAKAELTESWLGFTDPRITIKGSHYSIPFEQFDVELASDTLKLGETLVEMGAGTIDWEATGGREEAKDLSSGAGTVKTTGISASGDTITLSNPVLDYSFDFSNGSIKSAKGKMEGSAMTQTGERLELTQPVLDYSVDFSSGSFKSASGKMKGSAITQSGELLELKQPVLEYDAKGADETPDAVGTIKAQTLTLTNLSDVAATKTVVAAKLSGKSIPDSPQSVSLNMENLALNLDNGALNINQYSAEGFGLKGRGSLKGSNVMDAATVSGPLTVERFNMRKLLDKLNVDVDMADDNALSVVEGSASILVTPDGIELRDLKASFDQSKVTGFVKLIGKTPEVNLSIDKLALDGYLSPPDNIEGQDRAVDTIELPAQTIRDLNLKGQLRIGSLDVGGIASTNVDVQLAAANGDVRLFPMKAQVYGGSYSGDVRIKAQGELPQVSLNETFTNVDFGAFSQAMAGSQRLTGRVTGALKMTAVGHNTRDLKASSNGSVSFNFTDGVLDGINVMETVRNIVATANKEPRVPDEPNVTKFRSLQGTATISQGVLSNNDLKIDIPLMRIGGKGTLDLNTKAINYRVGANVVQEGNVPLEKELRFIADYTLPLVIGGTYEEPKVDATASIADLVKQYAKKRLQDTLLDKLGLGGKKDTVPPAAGTPPAGTPPTEPPPAEPQLTPEEKARQEKERMKDALDQKLKDKLKGILGDG